MRAQRIKTVFRRIGLAVVCGVADVLMMGLGACSYHAGHGHDYVVATSAGIGTLILAALGYAVLRTKPVDIVAGNQPRARKCRSRAAGDGTPTSLPALSDLAVASGGCDRLARYSALEGESSCGGSSADGAAARHHVCSGAGRPLRLDDARCP